MKALSIILFVICLGCTKQPSLPANSKFNVISVLNDSVWFGTGKALRIKEPGGEIESGQKFNLIVFTDIDYPGMGGGPKPNTNNGCIDPECTRTQSLVIYNVPLKKGHFKVAKLNKRSQQKNEYASMSYIGNTGGLVNRYVYKGLKPGWIKVTKFDKDLGIVEGRLDISFSQDTESDLLVLRNRMPATARFTDALFRIKITDVLLK
ncbi:hypothetical protein DYBT9623_05361 [Dyadobacter sp. CECT 9623]|uniref:Uncharacterized protein n=1 Tax=Dyadobacter linearis TaxID=2823330 RepID=A0ABM8UYB6_9BACT|nr:hypothetical protein [Dyadobacter sp. CECT 9623]CAG5074674.1 hypothetical protein DYBT9623_05361 [Dyadobacter sp. CECT 9623]